MKQVAKHLLILLALIGLFASATTYAQTPVGTLKGTVLSPEGETLKGARLTLSSPALMRPQEKAAEEGGRFIFQDLPGGVYSLRVEMAGFNPYVREKIQVDIGRTVNLPIFMTRPESGEVMVITEQGSPTVDVEKTTTSEVLSADFLEELPQTRDYQSTIQALPGVTGGANPNVQGSASDENAILLDGVNITDPVTGTFSMNFNFDAMQQVEAITGAYGAEYGQSMGGITNITTKSGGNEMEMKFTLSVQSGLLSPNRPAIFDASGLQLVPSELDRVFNLSETAVSMGGPVIKDKLWFYLSYSYNRSQITTLGVSVPRDYRGHYFFGKMTYQPVNAHQIVFSYFTNPTAIDNFRQSAFAPPESEATQFQGGGLLRLDWKWFINPNTRLETRVYSFSNFINVYPVPCTHDPFSGAKPCETWEEEGAIDFQTIGTLGVGNAYSADNYPRYTFDNRMRNNASMQLSRYTADLLGEHQSLVGVDYTQLRWDYLSGYIGNKYNVDILSDPYGSPYDPTNVELYYYLEYDGPQAFKSSGNQLSVFASDSWKPLRNLTMNYGLRFDSASFYNDVGDRVTNVKLVSPRFGVAWDPFKDQTTLLRFHIGRYIDTGRFAISSFINERYGGSKLILGDYFTGSENSLYLYDSGQSRYLTSNNLISPHTDEITVGLEREIVYDIALGVTGVAKWFSNLWEDDEVNLIWNENATQVLGGRYAGEINDIYRLRTPDEAFRRYQALQFTARQRFPDKKLQLIASYSLSRNFGNTATNLTANLDLAQQNPYYIGNLANDRRHVFKASGSYKLPLDFVLGANVDYQSGTPFNLYYYNDWYLAYNNLREPQGVHGRNPGWWTADVRITKDVDLRKFGKMEASFDVFNLLNNRDTTAISQGVYDLYGFIVPASILRPRSFQFGLRLEY